MDSNKALRYTVVGVRILLGLLFFASGLSYFFMEMPPADLETPLGKFMSGLLATGYFLPFLKAVEAVSGFLLFFKRTTPLALIVLAPILVQILLLHVLLEPKGMPVAVILVSAALFLAWAHWDKYEGLFKA